jgi:hypothetical protein
MQLRGLLPSVVWLVLATLARSQDGPAKLQLPVPVQVRGVVVDSVGDPIPDVRIDHISLVGVGALARSDPMGRFGFEAYGPSIVFRKSGWRSRLVPASRLTSDGRVVLERADDPETLPLCSKNPQCVTTGGIFCLPKVRGVDIGDRPNTIDTFEREFTISSWFGRWRTMLHGAGTSWGGPEPRTQEIWNSVEFSETQREARLDLVLDARGRTADGKLWRSIGREGESVFYYDQEPKDAALFDRVLDGLCVITPR